MEKGEPGVLTTHKRKELYTNSAVERFAAVLCGTRNNFAVRMGTAMLILAAFRVKKMFRSRWAFSARL